MKKTVIKSTILMWCLLMAGTTFAFNRQDTLRGSNGSGRNWWDVQHYSLKVVFDTATRTIYGSNLILADITSKPGDSLQIDLQDSMVLASVFINNNPVSFVREGNAWWITYPFSTLPANQRMMIRLYYHGKPRVAVHPPWDGGFIWAKDSEGKPWISVACQGLGASAWWPCKDYQGDEPDLGMTMDLSYIVPGGGAGKMNIIANGPLIEGEQLEDKNNEPRPEHVYYSVHNPINTYNATFYIGDYITWTDTLMGERGKLDLTFQVLRHNEKKARKHFAVTKQMLHCFEHWMGPYPFYEDGYKLVEAPFLGMEHQSAIAYGNTYKMGYLGQDRSKTGVGLLFDFIIIHESGHEWFGNNITAQDIADNWLHEGFTTYTEALFAECAFGKKKAFEYTTGEWNAILNDRNVIGEYGVNDEGSGDKYDKGSAVVHMIRMIMNDDEQFRKLLRGLNKDFYHKIVTSAQVEEYISRFAKYEFGPLFNQYLRTTNIPRLEWYIKDKKLHFRFREVVDGFTLPLDISQGKNKAVIKPTSEWQSIPWKGNFDIQFPKNFLIITG